MSSKYTDKRLKEFKNNYVEFIDQLSNIFPEESDLVSLKMFIQHEVSPSQLMQEWCENGLPYKKEIQARDLNFFYQNIHILLPNKIDLETKKIEHIKNLLHSKEVEENIDTIWAWFDLFISLSS